MAPASPVQVQRNGVQSVQSLPTTVSEPKKTGCLSFGQVRAMAMLMMTFLAWPTVYLAYGKGEMALTKLGMGPPSLIYRYTVRGVYEGARFML